ESVTAALVVQHEHSEAGVHGARTIARRASRSGSFQSATYRSARLRGLTTATSRAEAPGALVRPLAVSMSFRMPAILGCCRDPGNTWEGIGDGCGAGHPS